MRETDNGYAIRGVAAAIITFAVLVAALALATAASAFEADSERGVMLRQGDYLLQWEDKKPELCSTRARIVDKILNEFPDARIDRHELSNGTIWLFADYRNMSGEIFELRGGGLICDSYKLGMTAYISMMILARAPDRKFMVLPVWPEPED